MRDDRGGGVEKNGFSWQIILMTIAMLGIDDSTMMRAIDDYDGDDDGKNRLKFLHGNSY